MADEQDNSENANSPLQPQDAPLDFGEALMPSVMNTTADSAPASIPAAAPAQPSSAPSSDEDESSDDKDASAALPHFNSEEDLTPDNAPSAEFDAAHTSLMAPVAAQPQSQMGQAIDNAIQNPDVRQYMKDKYGFGTELDDAALKAAQDSARKKQMIIGILQGGDAIGKGFAQLGAGTQFEKVKDDPSLLNDVMKQAQQPVENLLARRQGMLQNQQLGQDQMKGQMMQSQLQSELALNDPNSQESKAAQAAYLPILQKAGLDTSLLQNASASTIKTVLQQPLEFADKQKQSELMAQNNADMKKLQMQSIAAQREFNNQFKTQSFADKQNQQVTQALNNDKQYQAANKQNNDIGQALDTLELARTNPAAAQAQALDVARIISGATRGPNSQEIAKFSGGSQALSDRAAQIYQQMSSGTITPENYAYTKQLLQHIQDSNNQNINKIQQSYAQKLTGRNNGDVNSNLQKITGNPSASVSPNQPSAPSGQQITPDVLNYAQAHGITPQQALQIKLQRTQGQQ